MSAWHTSWAAAWKGSSPNRERVFRFRKTFSSLCHVLGAVRSDAGRKERCNLRTAAAERNIGVCYARLGLAPRLSRPAARIFLYRSALALGRTSRKGENSCNAEALIENAHPRRYSPLRSWCCELPAARK